MRIFFILLSGIILLTNCTSTPIKNKTIGDVYILTSKHENNVFTHTLFQLPSTCFLKEIECSNPESIPSFPEYFASYVWAKMYWSPDGKYALFVDQSTQSRKDNYPIQTQKLLQYDPMDGSIKIIISGYKYISGITWNPNSEWAAMAIKKPDDQDMQIVLINPDGEERLLPIQAASEAGYHPFFFNGQSFDDNQHPVQWLNENELVFIRERGELQTDHLGELPELPIKHFFKFNISTLVEMEIELPVREANYTLSPNGNFAYYSTYFDKSGENNWIYDFNSHETSPMKFSPYKDAWSPDSQWILTCDNGHETYIITADLKNRKKIIDNCPIYASWMPDSDHIILLFLNPSKDHTYLESSRWYIASISANTLREIFIPNLELPRVDSINGIYVQPIKP